MNEKKIVCGVEDAQVGIQNIFMTDSEGLAVRSFGDACTNDKENDFKKFPADFRLMKLGTLDVKTGVITAEMPPRTLAMATQYINITKKNTEKTDIKIEE